MSTQDLLAIDPSCAICGVARECHHESESLETALRQSQDRWNRVPEIRFVLNKAERTAADLTSNWVLHKARLEVSKTYETLKRERLNAHHQYLSKLPCYTVYARYQGNPPIHPHQLQQLKMQIQHAEAIFRQGINEDWQRSCLRYPMVLDYFFSLVRISWPDDDDPLIRDPRIGGPKRVKGRRESSDHGRHH